MSCLHICAAINPARTAVQTPRQHAAVQSTPRYSLCVMPAEASNAVDDGGSSKACINAHGIGVLLPRQIRDAVGLL